MVIHIIDLIMISAEITHLSLVGRTYRSMMQYPKKLCGRFIVLVYTTATSRIICLRIDYWFMYLLRDKGAIIRFQNHLPLGF
jgi:hypothetical protein